MVIMVDGIRFTERIVSVDIDNFQMVLSVPTDGVPAGANC